MPKETSTDGPDQPDWTEDLYRSAANDQPPPPLDAAIKAAARQHEVRWYRNPGRLAALATAASVVLAALIMYHLPDREPGAGTDHPAGPMEVAPAPAASPPPPSQPVQEIAAEPTVALPEEAPGRAPLRQTRLTLTSKSARDTAEPLDALIEACGEPPGSLEDRELRSDERGWYLVVTDDAAVRYYRCVGGAWQAIAEPGSDEQ
jgi:hypothetical protein